MSCPVSDVVPSSSGQLCVQLEVIPLQATPILTVKTVALFSSSRAHISGHQAADGAQVDDACVAVVVDCGSRAPNLRQNLATTTLVAIVLLEVS